MSQQPEFTAARAGIATLEFVMALPVLLLLMVALTWLGFSVIGQSEVLVKARNNAWQKRFDDLSKNPLVFTATPLYKEKEDYATEKAAQKVDVSPVFSRLPGPEASHTVLAGSWDYRAMPLKSPPNWKLQGVAFANAKTAGFQTALGALPNVGSLLGDIASQAIAQAAREALGAGGGSVGDSGSGLGQQEPNTSAEENQATGEAPGAGGGGIDDIGSGLGQQKPDTSAEENKQNAEREQKKAELRAERDRLRQEIDQSEQELNKLIEEQGKLPNPLEDKPVQGNPPNSNDPQQEEQDKTPASTRRAQQIEVLQTKIKRLKSDLKDVEAELKAAN